MFHRKELTYTIFILLVLITFFPVVTAFITDVEDTYSSEDEVKSLDMNMYHIYADDDKKIHWKAEVSGNGTIQVFLMRGHIENSPFLESNYYESHSTEFPVRECSDSYSANPKSGDLFTILVWTTESYNVSYEISIEISDNTGSEKILSGLICLGLFFGVAIVVYLIFYLIRRRKASDFDRNTFENKK